MKLEPVIGLEIHVQLKTRSKMFCGCSARSNTHTKPNTNVCPICLGHPGALPVPNQQAVRYAVLFGLAVNGEIAEQSKFDRKNYFYPDLPKGYQISQFDLPVVGGGELKIHVPKAGDRENLSITLTRAHLEEDAAKNIHEGDKSYIDFNRGGTPLLEIVTEPDFRTAKEAKIFLQELRLLVRALKISDGDMEKGQLRCDANVSMREYDEESGIPGMKLNAKTEVKNLNSFKNVERAIEYEIMRQTKLWKNGSPPMTDSTYGWNANKQITEMQRSKEEAADYRYFPEPDIPQMMLRDLADEMKNELPELPQAKRQRFMDEYGLSSADAIQLTDSSEMANYTEQVMSELGAWLESMPDISPEDVEVTQKKLVKLVSSWLINKLGGLMNDRKIDIRTIKVTAENFAELITLIFLGKVTQKAALTILEAMLDDGKDPSQVMEDQQLGKMDDESVLADIIEKVIANNPSEVERYKGGETKLLKFFIGMVMKETEGNADPGTAKNIIVVKLDEV